MIRILLTCILVFCNIAYFDLPQKPNIRVLWEKDTHLIAITAEKIVLGDVKFTKHGLPIYEAIKCADVNDTSNPIPVNIVKWFTSNPNYPFTVFEYPYFVYNNNDERKLVCISFESKMEVWEYKYMEPDDDLAYKEIEFVSDGKYIYFPFCNDMLIINLSSGKLEKNIKNAYYNQSSTNLIYYWNNDFILFSDNEKSIFRYNKKGKNIDLFFTKKDDATPKDYCINKYNNKRCIVVDGKLILNIESYCVDQDSSYLLCIDLSTKKSIWRKQLGAISGLDYIDECIIVKKGKEILFLNIDGNEILSTYSTNNYIIGSFGGYFYWFMNRSMVRFNPLLHRFESFDIDQDILDIFISDMNYNVFIRDKYIYIYNTKLEKQYVKCITIT